MSMTSLNQRKTVNMLRSAIDEINEKTGMGQLGCQELDVKNVSFQIWSILEGSEKSPLSFTIHGPTITLSHITNYSQHLPRFAVWRSDRDRDGNRDEFRRFKYFLCFYSEKIFPLFLQWEMFFLVFIVENFFLCFYSGEFFLCFYSGNFFLLFLQWGIFSNVFIIRNPVLWSKN